MASSGHKAKRQHQATTKMTEQMGRIAAALNLDVPKPFEKMPRDRELAHVMILEGVANFLVSAADRLIEPVTAVGNAPLDEVDDPVVGDGTTTADMERIVAEGETRPTKKKGKAKPQSEVE